MDRVGDVGRRARHTAGCSYADAHGCDDERRSRCEGGQNETGDGGDRPCDARHSPAHASCDRFFVEVVCRVSQGEELQDALLEGSASLVENADKKTRCHEDSISRLFNHSTKKGKLNPVNDKH